MRYFRPFANNALFLLQKLNIRYTKCPMLTRRAEKNNSCMQRMPMYFPARLINEIFPKWTRLILWM